MEKKSIGERLLVANLKLSRKAYSDFAILYNSLYKYSCNQTEKSTDELELYIMVCSNGMPLPSGRWGNQLAVALEMQMYKGALFMINNADRLGIDLEHVSSIFGGEDVWNIDKVFELSKLSFDFTKVSELDEDYKNYPDVVKHKNSNIDAALELEKIINKRYSKRSKLK